mmetsp:Transcript_31861/g.83285  ORF Transcript_31861/g.83285 Transcript_31861/m.83285 type:complete len:1767 (+) Transcript_31861:80-5380(+)
MAEPADAAPPQQDGTEDLGAPDDQFLSMVDQVARNVVDDENDKYSAKAFFCLPRDVFPRKQCIMLVENKWFDRTVLGLIALNCLTMTIFASPIVKVMLNNVDNIKAADLEDTSLWAARHWTYPLLRPMGDCKLDDVLPCSFEQVVDFIFLIIFAIEMLIKMLAYGLCRHKNSYFCGSGSGWNYLDFTVVLVGFVDMFAGGAKGINAIRLVKTLRPLRTMNRIRGLRVLVKCIFEALPQMLNVLVFLVFTLILFGLFGHAFFKGKLRHSCHFWTGDGWESTGEICDAECEWDDMTLELIGTCNSLGNMTKNMESQRHNWRWSYSCRVGHECRCSESGLADPWCSYLDNPNYGITSFDSLPWAMVSLFQAISLEGWVDMMYQLMDGCSMFVIIFFIALVLFGAIIVMNLFLAVLCDNFEMAGREDDEPEEKEEDVEKMTERAIKELSWPDSKLRQMCLDLVKIRQFDYFIQGCILFNTLLMCLKWAPQPANPVALSIAFDAQWDYLPEEWWFFLTTMNILLTLIFAVETAVKILGLGWPLYKKDAMNLFDAFVVAFSIIEIALDLNSKANPGTGTVPLPLSVLRAFRIFRLFKLVRSVETLRKILATLVSSLQSVVYLALLLCLVILIFILLGIELFGARYPHAEYNFTSDHFPLTWEDKKMMFAGEEEGSRYNFDDFGSALLSIFVVLSGENWNEIMFDSHRATWDNDMGGAPYFPFAIVYFLLLFVVGNLLLFNLFIAILLSNFEDDEEEEEEEEGVLDEGEGEDGASQKKDAAKTDGQFVWMFGAYRPTSMAGQRKSAMANGSDADGQEAQEAVEEEEPGFPEKPSEFCQEGDPKGPDKSCGIFGWDNPIRRGCSKIVLHKYFEPVVIVMILTSTLCLVLDMPHISQDEPLRVAIRAFNIFFTIVFFFEMLLKIIASGFLFSRTPSKFTLAPAYLRSGWNILDFLIVIISVLSLMDTGIDFLQQLRTFRAIRPMRLLSRYESLKITFQTLLKSIPAMGSLATVATLFFMIFGILGLELFGGKFGYCYDPVYDGGRLLPGLGALDGKTDYYECMNLPRYNLTRRTTDGVLLMDMADMYPGTIKELDGDAKWIDFVEFPQWFFPQFGCFDNIGFSLILLFEVSALEGWPDVMHWAMDTDGNEMYIQPHRIDTNPISWPNSDDWSVSSEGRAPPPSVPTDIHVTSNIEAGIFFVMWIIFGCFVIVNLTIGIVVDTFGAIKQENDGLLLMSEDEADWVTAQKQVLAQRPLKAARQPTQPWRLNFYYLVTSTRFEIFIMAVIMANMLQMACDWFEPNPSGQAYIPSLKTAMGVLNIIFFAIYVVEMLVKWIGLGIDQYFKDPWSLFDFVLVMISLLDVVLSSQDGEMPFPAAVVRCLRLFRVARILRIVKTAKQLRTIMLTVYISLPQLNNILILIALFILIADMLLVGRFWTTNYTPGNFDPSNHLNWTVVKSYAAGERYYESDWRFDAFVGTNWGESINRHANFAYSWTGALTLVRSSTGESFNNIMHDLYSWWWGHNRMTCSAQNGPIIASSGSIEYETVTIPSTGLTVTRPIPLNSCGDTAYAFVVYFLFQVVMAYIVLSIMIGIILENFANVGSETKKIRMEDLEDFREVWLKYDPKGTFVVPSHNLLAILQQLRAPLGIQGVQPALTRADMLKHLGKLDIPDHNGYIHFMETLTAVSNLHAGVPVPVCETTNKMAKLAQRAPGMQKLDQAAHSALTNYLVSLLQSRWRGYAMRVKYTDEPTSSTEGGGGYDGKVKSNQVAPGPA